MVKVGVRERCLFSNEPCEKRPVMTIEDFVVYSDDHFESRPLWNALCPKHKYPKHEYSPIPRRWDSRRSSKCKLKSWMAKVQISFRMSRSKRVLWWPSRISFCILTTISSLIFSGTGCIRCTNIRCTNIRHSVNLYTVQKRLESLPKSFTFPEREPRNSAKEP